MVDFNNRTLGHYKCSCCYCQLADKEQDGTTSQYNLDEHGSLCIACHVKCLAPNHIHPC